MSLQNQLQTVRQTLLKTITDPQPTPGIDLDGCVDELTTFFSLLTHVWPGNVVVITFRSDRSKAAADLERFGIHYNDLMLVNSFDAKAEVIAEKSVNVYFDDQPEMLKNIPEDVQVLLVRNGGNYDFETKHWLFSEKTGRMV